LAAALACSPGLEAQSVTGCDDFEDGGVLDGDPVCWQTDPILRATVDAVGGDAVVRNVVGGTYGALSSCESFAGDLSIETTVRLDDPEGTGEVDLFACYDPDRSAYVVELYSTGRVILVRFDVTETDLRKKIDEGSIPEFDAAVDHRFRLDVRGNAVEARVWDPQGDMPADPVVHAVDGTYREGRAGIGAHSPHPGPGFRAVFHEVCVSQGAPPEGQQLPSDANQDGGLDLSDATWLLGHLFLGTHPELPCEGRTASDPGPGDLALLDANGDGSIDIADATTVLGYLFQGSSPPALGTSCVPIVRCPDGPGPCP
jgi:hypothetical protein